MPNTLPNGQPLPGPTPPADPSRWQTNHPFGPQTLGGTPTTSGGMWDYAQTYYPDTAAQAQAFQQQTGIDPYANAQPNAAFAAFLNSQPDWQGSAYSGPSIFGQNKQGGLIPVGAQPGNQPTAPGLSPLGMLGGGTLPWQNPIRGRRRPVVPPIASGATPPQRVPSGTYY